MGPAWWSRGSHFVENGYPSLRFPNMVKMNIHEHWTRVTRFNPLWVSAITHSVKIASNIQYNTRLSKGGWKKNFQNSAFMKSVQNVFDRYSIWSVVFPNLGLEIALKLFTKILWRTHDRKSYTWPRVVTKISSCRVNTTSRRGIKQLGISFGSTFLLFSHKISRGSHS